MKILVVDDSGYARGRIREILQQGGYEIIEAEGGEQALEIYQAEKPAVVTIDLIMPVMDGIELTRRLKALDPDVRIIVISSDIQEQTQQEAFAAGASAFLPKMETMPVFLNAIDVLLGEERLLDLSAAERDVFSELTNRAMGQAARAIESLLDRRVQLVVPEIRIMGLEDFKVFLKREGFHDGTVIQQGFSGERHGHAYLLFGRYQAQIFINTLLSEKREINGLSNTDQTVLNEVGNMVLNAAISIIGDQLKTRLAMSFPTVFIKLGHDQLSETLSASYGTTDRAVVLVSHLRIGDTDITCYLALIVSESTVRHLLDSMKLLDTG
mgnify:CR=1 FL=1|jgi:two-component system, chemotaxis family, chemotaxis protein CheY